MSDFLEFSCPSCSRPHLVDFSELPEDGVWRACPSCGSQIHVTREGARPGSSDEPAADDAEAEGLGVFLKRSSGGIERVSTEAIEQGIQMARILPWDLVSDDSREFCPISEHPEFQSRFLRGDFVPSPKPRCANHADALPSGTCRRCGRSYCDACVQALLQIQPRLCPACSGVVAEPDARLRERAPWQRPKEIARFPVDENAWIASAAMGVLFWIAGSTALALPLYLAALLLLVDAVERSSRGAKTWKIASGVDFRELFRKALPVGVLSIALAIPFLVSPLLLGPSLAVLVQFPLTLFMFFYYPMAAGLPLVADDKDEALKPKTVLRAIWALRDEYFAYIAVFIAVAVGTVAVITVLSFLPWIDRFLQSIALGYAWIVQAHILGFFIYMNRERIRVVV